MMEQPKYHIDIFWSDEDGGYIANVPDLRYCSAFGESYEEALREVLVAMDLHLETLRELDRPIPESTTPIVSSSSAPHEVFAAALRESYEALTIGAGRSPAEVNEKRTQDFFRDVINDLRLHGLRISNETFGKLIEQQRKQRQVSQTPAQESVNAYMDFLNSMSGYYRSGQEQSQKGAKN
jgi:predicted RNase H-like HicB family nuclease